jgi:tetratricopeptide (TPR) repeat protein
VGAAAREARQPAAPWLRAAPVLLFTLLALWRWSATPGPPEGVWLDRAGDLARGWAERGGNPLRALLAVEDPRVAPGALLLRIGLSPTALGVLTRILGLGLGALAVALLARRARGPGAGVSAWLLAASPLWIEACARGDPAVALGLGFVALGGRLIPAAAALVLGWALAWSPWAWVTLLLVPVGWLLRPERRRAAVAILASALVLVFLLDPPAALNPAAWWSAMRWQGRIEGLASGFSPFGTSHAAWPAIGALHLPALALLLLAAREWPGRARQGDFAPLGFAAAIVLALPAGLSRATPLLIVLPWAAAETGGALAWLAPRAGGLMRRAAPIVLVVPLLALGATRWSGGGETRGDPRAAALAWVAANLPPGSLVACDADFAAPDSSRMIWLPLPFHSTDPRVYRGAYWPGWYGAFRGFVVSERLMSRYLRDPQAAPEALAFHLRVMRAAAADQVFGSTAGRRLHVLVLPAGADAALGAGWKERLRAGAAGGVPGAFVAGLGGALIRGGRAGDGTDLLREALAAGYREKGIYLNLANGRLSADQPAEAGLVLEEALKAYPDEPDLLYNFGLVLLRSGYWDRAIATLGRLRAIWPRSADTAYLLGLALANSSHSAAAPRVLQESLDLGLTGARRQACVDELTRLRSAAR